LGAREVNHVKAVPDNDKGNILNFNASLVKLLGSTPGSTVALGDVISIGFGLKGNCDRVSKPKPLASSWP
jgi:hypothetical protein